MFDSEKVSKDIILWIRSWFDENGPDAKAVVGISGGKDSSVTAALCAEALGKDRVVGVLMPNGHQWDLDVSKDLVKHLGIREIEINIKDAYDGLFDEVSSKIETSKRAAINLAPRIRMAALYAVAQSLGGMVANTCNLSEDWVGYNTKYGDGAGDFSPLAKMTVQEVKAIGRYLGLPEKFVEKTPIDGLCGKTDEDNLGFTYAVLDEYIRTGNCPDSEIKEKIDRLHKSNLFKLEPMPVFPYEP